MIVYVESNFVLELALEQEQHESCRTLLRLCKTGRIRIVIPAFSMAEPHTTLYRRGADRRQTKAALDRELGQLARTASYSERLKEFGGLIDLLVDSADVERDRLYDVLDRVLILSEIIPLDSSILRAAVTLKSSHPLSAPDAIVYASVLNHLAKSGAEKSCFLNRNARDFDEPDLVAELKGRGCRMILSFDDGLKYVASEIRKTRHSD